VPVGVGEVHAAYSRSDVSSSNDDWRKLAVGYVHNLSKRTALYATFARVTNNGAQVVAVANNGLGNGNLSTITSSPGGSSNGYEFGIRHSF
jgi:predicted porin